MSDISQRIAGLSPEKRALLEKKLAGAQPRGVEPQVIAVIGMGCRMPGGADSPEAFWRLLTDGVDAIREMPADRRSASKDYPALRWAGVLDRADQFDPEFFGISPTEARRMDPQQRLLLEVAWEALESAGEATERLAGSATGVFIGVHSQSIDYLLKQLSGPAGVDVHTTTGSAHSIAANRISYCFDLRGPSVALDTACSSSLVAVHLACQSLRTGDCEMALAGGVNLLLSPVMGEAFAPLQFMAPDGRCKTFDSLADGFVRAEGCGVIVLKPLGRALADGDPVLAVIRGSAVNQDGRSNGLTAPNGRSQQDVIRAALKNAGVEPASIGYVETHGTGTPLGDPIEVEALVETLGAGRRRDQVCRLGAVKTNIGHLEGAAGITGVIKTVLCLQHRYIPKNLHFKELNPHLAIGGKPFAIPVEGESWESVGPRRAGVSSFGFGGTNAHVVLEEAPQTNADCGMMNDEKGAFILPISARSEEALVQLKKEYEALLADPNAPAIRDLAYSASVRREHAAYRIAVVGRTREEWLTALSQWKSSNQGAEKCAENIDELIRGALIQDAEAMRALAKAYMNGARIDWAKLYPNGGRFVPLPSYPWQHERYWLPGEEPADLSDGLIYELDWERRELASDRSSRLVDEPLAPIAQELMKQPIWGEEVRYDEFGPRLNQLAAFYIRQALRAMDWSVDAREAAALKTKVAPGQQRLFNRLLEILGESEHISTAAEFETLERDWPQHAIEIGLLRRCGENLAAVLRGEIGAVQVLFPNGSTRELTDFYFNSPLMRPWNLAAGKTINRLVVPHSAETNARILELGAGTGSATQAVMAHVLSEQIEYCFTDVSQLFLAQAEQKFGPRTWMRYEILDIESDIAGQGFKAGTFDVVLAANVLHATADLRASIRRAGELLAPGGVLVLLEVTAHEPWMDLIFGLTEGWWKFADRDLRPDAPLVSSERWPKLLREEGFADVALIGNDRQFPQALLIARKPQAEKHAGQWLILPDKQGLAECLARQLGNAFVAQASGETSAFILPETATANGVIDLRGIDQTNPLGACEGALEFTKQMIGAGTKAPLFFITRGAQNSADSPTALAQSTVWGLGRVIALEHPEIWGGLIDLDPAWPIETAAAWLAAELVNPDGEDQIVLRESGRYLPRLIPATVKSDPITTHSDGAYLITGGLGGLGLKVARWLVEQGARDVVLTSRRGLKPENTRAREAIEKMESDGARVTVVAADVADRAAMSILFKRFGRDLPQLRGVVHAAGTVNFTELERVSSDELAAAFRSKVDGTQILDELAPRGLDFFVMFSSGATLWGSRSLASYAAANQYMDALAHERQRLGLPALVINWGWWAGGGTPPEAEAYYNQIGLEPLSDEQALAAIGSLIGSQTAQAAVVRADWARFTQVYNMRRKRPLLEKLMANEECGVMNDKPGESDAATSQDSSPIIHHSSFDSLDDIERLVRAEVARTLGFNKPAALDPHRGFYQMGLDSILSLQLHKRLEAALGVRLPPTVAFEKPTIEALTQFLSEMLGTGSEPVCSEDELVSQLAAKLEQIK